jgi:hypothetical protein
MPDVVKASFHASWRREVLLSSVSTSALSLSKRPESTTLPMHCPSPSSIEQVFEVDGLTSPVADTAWFRPLEFYTEQLRKSGFTITSLTEPHPSPAQVRTDSFWRKGFTRPLFMLIAAQKLAR